MDHNPTGSIRSLTVGLLLKSREECSNRAAERPQSEEMKGDKRERGRGYDPRRSIAWLPF